MFKKLLILLEIVILVFFLFWHWKLGLVRYFDGDEFTHLHWAYSFSVGEQPYTDFFYLFPPFFLYPFAFLFKIFSRTAVVLINARMLIFFVFLATSGVLFLLIKKLRSVSVALLTIIIFAFLPLPFDKMIEVRPDLAATCLALAGLLLFLKGYEGDKGDEGEKGKQGQYFFLSGLFYAMSMGFVPKTVFFLVPVGVVMAVSYLSGLSRLRKKEKKIWLFFFAGFLAVGVVLLAVVASFGNLPFALYSITRMAAEITNTLGAKFYMRPDIFFYPNDTYYGLPGWSWPLSINLIIYISASIWAIGRLVSSLSYADDKKCVREFLVAGSFWANLIAFVNFYPLKHAQYLIPVAPFVAFYFADLWEAVLSKLPKSLGLLKTAVTLTLLFFLCLVGFQMNQKKVNWVNTATLDKINNLLHLIPPDASVYDLTGESVFFKNGYYFCCLPYGQYEESLYFKVPDIKVDAEKRGTNYVYLGSVDRLNAIPARDAKYIMENFTTALTPDKILLQRKSL